MLERICNGAILFLVSAHYPWTTELPHEITPGQLLLNNSVLDITTSPPPPPGHFVSMKSPSRKLAAGFLPHGQLLLNSSPLDNSL